VYSMVSVVGTVSTTVIVSTLYVSNVDDQTNVSTATVTAVYSTGDYHDGAHDSYSTTVGALASSLGADHSGEYSTETTSSTEEYEKTVSTVE